MVPGANKIMSDIGMWPITIDRASFVDELFDVFPVGQHNRCRRTKLERVDTAILFCPLREGQVRAFRWYEV